VAVLWTTFLMAAPPRGAFPCMARLNEPILPMIIDNMRANGVRSLACTPRGL
jgi:hypothetical protein